jgi:hypothetical protein
MVGEEIMAKNLLLLILAGLFLGCSHTAGRKYDVTAMDRIEVGQTSESEVVAMLGMPLTAQKLSNGINVYAYAYGDRCRFGLGTSVDSLQVQFYNGVVINKWQELMQN